MTTIFQMHQYKLLKDFCNFKHQFDLFHHLWTKISFSVTLAEIKLWKLCKLTKLVKGCVNCTTQVFLFPPPSSSPSSCSTRLYSLPSLSNSLSLCVLRRVEVGGSRAFFFFFSVCFILLGTTLLPDNSLKTGKNAIWLNDSTLLLSLSLSLCWLHTLADTANL